MGTIYLVVTLSVPGPLWAGHMLSFPFPTTDACQLALTSWMAMPYRRWSGFQIDTIACLDPGSPGRTG